MTRDIADGPTIGDNGQLRSYVERIENVNAEIGALNDDRKSIFAEAKSQGFDVKQMRRAIKIRAMDHAKWEEEEIILDTYLRNLGIG